MRILLFLVCFLIISCDLPSEANKDCSGNSGGVAALDDCGVCSGGDTGIIANTDKDFCGVCFGNNSCYDAQCDDETAINYFENAQNVDNSLCMYNLCNENYSYITSSDPEDCNDGSSTNIKYSIGEQLN